MRPAPDADPLRAAFVDLLAAERRVRGREGHTPDGLSLAHLRLLGRLLDEPEMPAGRLAAAAEVTAASATQMLDGLERRGMVARRRDEGDRRVVLVCLTDEGRRLATERRAAFGDLWDAAMDGLTEQQRAGGLEVLRRLGAFLASIAEQHDGERVAA